jgi:serine/threonine protein kinase
MFSPSKVRAAGNWIFKSSKWPVDGQLENCVEEQRIYEECASDHVFAKLVRVEANAEKHIMVFVRASVDLFAWLRRDYEPMSDRLRVAAQLCRLLARLHARGIAHLDLDPQTIVVFRKDKIRLIDAGAAGHFNPRQARHINIGEQLRYDKRIPGKLPYILPAIYDQEPFNAFCADRYSLAVTLWVLLLSHGRMALYASAGEARERKMRKIGLTAFTLELHAAIARSHFTDEGLSYFADEGLMETVLPLLESVMYFDTPLLDIAQHFDTLAERKEQRDLLCDESFD